MFITEPDAFSTSVFVVTVSSCHSGNNGSADLTVSGGTMPYSYAWSSGANTEDVSALVPGTYVVTISDANGCTITETAVIAQDAALTINPMF